MFEKRVFKTVAVTLSFFTILSLPIGVTFWVYVTLSEIKDFSVFQSVLLSVTFCTSRLHSFLDFRISESQ